MIYPPWSLIVVLAGHPKNGRVFFQQATSLNELCLYYPVFCSERKFQHICLMKHFCKMMMLSHLDVDNLQISDPKDQYFQGFWFWEVGWKTVAFWKLQKSGGINSLPQRDLLHPRPPLSVEDIISRFREMAQ